MTVEQILKYKLKLDFFQSFAIVVKGPHTGTFCIREWDDTVTYCEVETGVWEPHGDLTARVQTYSKA